MLIRGLPPAPFLNRFDLPVRAAFWPIPLNLPPHQTPSKPPCDKNTFIGFIALDLPNMASLIKTLSVGLS